MASDAPKTWKQADEWRLIGGAADEMQRNKVRNLLMALTRSADGKGYEYRYSTSDSIGPKTVVDGVSIAPLFQGATPFRLR